MATTTESRTNVSTITGSTRRPYASRGSTVPKRTGRPWRRLVPVILQRDGGICHLCGRHGADTADHLTPAAHGGNDHPDNLRAAHVWCNRLRGDRPIDVARADIARRLAIADDQHRGYDW